MEAAGQDLHCESSEDMGRGADRLIEDDGARERAGRRGRAFAEREYGGGAPARGVGSCLRAGLARPTYNRRRMERNVRAQPDLRSLLAALWRRKWLFLGIFVSIPVAVYLISTLVPKTYEASALIRIKTRPSRCRGSRARRLSADRLGGAADQRRRRSARRRRGSWSCPRMPRLADGACEPTRYDVDERHRTDLLQLTAQAEHAGRAAAIANAYAPRSTRAHGDELDGRSTAPWSSRPEPAATTPPMRRPRRSSPASSSNFARRAPPRRTAPRRWRRPPPPATPISPAPEAEHGAWPRWSRSCSRWRGGAQGAARPQASRDPNELEPLLGTPLLSVIPRAAFPGARPAAGPVREAFRTLAASLVYFNIDRPLWTVMVVQPDQGRRQDDGRRPSRRRARQGRTERDPRRRRPEAPAGRGVAGDRALGRLDRGAHEPGRAAGRAGRGGRGRRAPAGARRRQPSSESGATAELGEHALAAGGALGASRHRDPGHAADPQRQRRGAVARDGVRDGARRQGRSHHPRRAPAHAPGDRDGCAGHVLGVVATGAAGAGLYGYGADYYDEDEGGKETGGERRRRRPDRRRRRRSGLRRRSLQDAPASASTQARNASPRTETPA